MPASPADSFHSSSSPDMTTIPSPWAAVVLEGGGDDLEPTPPPPIFSSVTDPSPPREDHRDDSDGNVGTGKAVRPAWKALPNDVLDAIGKKTVDGVTGGVMGDDMAWPALSESTRSYSKSSSSNSLVSTTSSSVLTEGSSSGFQGPILPNSPHILATNNNGRSRATENHTIPQSRKPSRHNDSGAVSNSSAVTNSGATSNSGGSWQPSRGFNHPHLASPRPPHFTTFQVPPNGYANIVPPIVDFFNTESPYRGSGWDSRPAGVFTYPPVEDVHANSFRQGSFGPRDGNPQNNSYRNRHDQWCGNPPDRRDVHLHPRQRGAPRGYRGPTPSTFNDSMYLVSQPVRQPFGPPIGFSDIAFPYYYPIFPMDVYRSPQIMDHTPKEMAMPVPETSLPASLVKQIHYYFSDSNLNKDAYLKSNMDNQGWVPINLIAGFRRVRSLTHDVQLILKALEKSSIVEIKDDKIRRRGVWKKWVRFPAHGSLEPGSPSSKVTDHNEQSLASSIQNITLEGTSNHVDAAALEDSLSDGKSFDQTPSI